MGGKKKSVVEVTARFCRQDGVVRSQLAVGISAITFVQHPQPFPGPNRAFVQVTREGFPSYRPNGVVISPCKGPPGCATRQTGCRVLCSAAWQELMVFCSKQGLVRSPGQACADRDPWRRQSAGPLVVTVNSTHLSCAGQAQFGLTRVLVGSGTFRQKRAVTV
jgi:hypothetical protein